MAINQSYSSWLSERGLHEAPVGLPTGVFVREINPNAMKLIVGLTSVASLSDDTPLLRRLAAALTSPSPIVSLVLASCASDVPLFPLVRLHRELTHIYLLGFDSSGDSLVAEHFSVQKNKSCVQVIHGPRPEVLRLDQGAKREFWEKVRS